MRDTWRIYVRISVNWIVSPAESLNYQGVDIHESPLKFEILHPLILSRIFWNG